MGFSINHDDVYNSLMAEGKYEFIIKSAYEDATKNGAMCICLHLIVRNDVEQKYQNKHLWYQSWKRRNPDETCVYGYSRKDINAISKAAGLANGKSYESLDDWFDDLKGKVISASVYHDEFNGETHEKVRYINRSAYPDCRHVFKSSNTPTATNTNDAFYAVEEDDLPFDE